jgi:hypothetical protein
MKQHRRPDETGQGCNANMTRQNSKGSMRNLTPVQRRRADALAIGYHTVASRLSRGWPPERATGQTAYLRSPAGTRQRYHHVGGGKWARLAHGAAAYLEERRTVEAICRDEGLPLPQFIKGSRRPLPPRPVKPKAPPPVSTDEYHRDFD